MVSTKHSALQLLENPNPSFVVIRYYVDLFDGDNGPVEKTALQKAWAEEDIDETSQVWVEGMDSWKAIKDVPGLLDYCKAGM